MLAYTESERMLDNEVGYTAVHFIWATIATSVSTKRLIGGFNCLLNILIKSFSYNLKITNAAL